MEARARAEPEFIMKQVITMLSGFFFFLAIANLVQTYCFHPIHLKENYIDWFLVCLFLKIDVKIGVNTSSNFFDHELIEQVLFAAKRS